VQLAKARCLACGGSFTLEELLDDWTCRCPRCARALAESDREKARLLRHAATVDRLVTELTGALSELTDVKGNLEVLPAPVIGTLLTDVAWHRQLRLDVAAARHEIEQVRDAFAAWQAELTGDGGAVGAADDGSSNRRRFASGARGLASRFREISDGLAEQPGAGSDDLRGRARRLAAAFDQHAEDAGAIDVGRAGSGTGTTLGDAVAMLAALDAEVTEVAGRPGRAAPDGDGGGRGDEEDGAQTTHTPHDAPPCGAPTEDRAKGAR
jgi:hypothetical protein